MTHFDQTINAQQHSAMYNDVNEIKSIAANPDKNKALELAANQFEAVFLQSVLSHMRKASEALKDPEENSPFSSKQQSFFREMYDSQLAVEMSQKQSLGISDMLVKQLSQHQAFKSPNQVVASNKQAIETSSVSMGNQSELEEGSGHLKPQWQHQTPLALQIKAQLDDETL